MKTKLSYPAAIVAITLALPASADVVYSTLNTGIPTNFTGVTVTVLGGDINPFFGGVGVANTAGFQPARLTADNLGTLKDFAAGATVDGSLNYGTSDGGSQDHLGNTFTSGQNEFLGFKSSGDYGWMQVVFTNNTAGAMLKNWAYDNTGAAIKVGGIVAPGDSIQSQTVDTGLVLNAATFAYEMNSSALPGVAADLQLVDGNLSLDGTVTLSLFDLAGSPTAFAAGTTLSLINYAGTWDGGFFTYGTGPGANELTNNEVFSDGLNSWRINYGATTGGLNFAGDFITGSFVNLTAIPEPGSLLALGCLVGSGLLLRRRK